MKTPIPYGRQHIDENDIDAIVEILKSDWLTQGPKIPQFEEACAAFAAAKYATALNSATSALHVACMALDLGSQDWLWTSPITFVASANCGRYCGANVDFVDIDPQTYNMSATALAEKLRLASGQNRLPKVVVVVHMAGQSCDMQAIHRLSLEYGFKIIEDASHAIGGTYLNQPIGCSQYSDLSIFSFHPVKIITTAEGGMILTNNPILKEKCDILRAHGITRNPELMQGESEGAWYYQQIMLGYNYRMTDLQAGLGLSQLQRIDAFVDRRHAIAARYNEALQALPLTLPYQSPMGKSAYHLYLIQCQSRKQVFDALRDKGIAVNVHYIPVHLQPYYQQFGFKRGDFPVAEAYYAQTITLPIFYSMTDEQQSYVIDSLFQVLG